MPFVNVGTENSGAVELHYEDYGSGSPVVLIHGYPLSGRAWDKQLPPLLAAGHRVITYDRRGAGASSQPSSGYDWDTFAADLAALIDKLGLAGVTLVGHSMGTGEVTRYLGTYGSAKVDRAVLIGPIPPYMAQAPDNPDGIPVNLFDGFRQSVAADAPAWMKGFLDNFYNIDQFGGNRVSDEAYKASFNVAVSMSALAAYAEVATWQADFRADLPKIDVPVLVIQGDADRILPFEKTGKRLPGLVPGLELVVIEGGPHAIPWTHAGEVNAALLSFLGHPAAKP
jgi:non-heme chloroperoxidase